MQIVWSDSLQQEGAGGKQHAGYGSWFGEGHALNFAAPLEGRVQTNNWAELTVAIEVLMLIPKTTDTQLCVDSELVTDGATLCLEGWLVHEFAVVKKSLPLICSAASSPPWTTVANRDVAVQHQVLACKATSGLATLEIG